MTYKRYFFREINSESKSDFFSCLFWELIFFFFFLKNCEFGWNFGVISICVICKYPAKSNKVIDHDITKEEKKECVSSGL